MNTKTQAVNTQTDRDKDTGSEHTDKPRKSQTVNTDTGWDKDTATETVNTQVHKQSDNDHGSASSKKKKSVARHLTYQCKKQAV